MTKSSEFGGLQLAWLEAFVQTVDDGKRLAAATNLGIHPGTLTKHLDSLACWCGGGVHQLLFMSSLSAELTETGERLLPVARQVVHMLREARGL